MCLAILLVPNLGRSAAADSPPTRPVVEFLGDAEERLLSTRQDWGELGFNTAAHAPGVAGQALRIGDKTFAQGLGHHANGEIVFGLDGEFASFDAAVGIQTQASGAGSVVFRVLVDDEARFTSGPIKESDGPQPIHVAVEGGQVLRLQATDAGDGITCDMANWCDARITRSKTAVAVDPQPPVDVARFARVVTWDPNRMDGCRASRIQEFLAEDLFLETDVQPDASGCYQAPATTNGLACIGLQWLNHRALSELGLEFADAVKLPDPAEVHVQAWLGESAWQGRWEPLPAGPRLQGSGFVVHLDRSAKTMRQKVRWVYPASAGPVRRLSAFTRSRWKTSNFRVEAERGTGRTGILTLDNGELTGGSPLEWNLEQPLRLQVRHSRFSIFNSDATVLRFQLPTGKVAVAVDDVLSRGSVYVADPGLLVSRESDAMTLDGYRRKIAGRVTVLQRVRQLPEQTLAQAMARTHHQAQREGPVLLSLAADNFKFVAERDGILRFQKAPTSDGDWLATARVMQPQFGVGNAGTLTRHLEGDWLPIPVIESVQNGVRCTERIFVAPVGEPATDLRRLNQKSVCIVEFTLHNEQSAASEVAFELGFLLNQQSKEKAQLTACPEGFLVGPRGQPFGQVRLDTGGDLSIRTAAGALKLAGRLAAQSDFHCLVYLAGMNFAPADFHGLPDVSALRAATGKYWESVLGSGMLVETPDPLLNRVIRSSQVRCFLDARSEAEGERIAPWIAAMSYGPLESEAHSVIRGMDFFGHSDFARRGLEFFIHRYNAQGFLTTGYTTFGTAWHLWTLGEHYALAPDPQWLRRVAPEIVRVGQWIVRQTEKTRTRNAAGEPVPEYGLMPPGVMADWNAFAYHFCLNGYYYAALKQVGDALRSIGDPHGPEFIQQAAELRTNILRAYHWTQAQSPVLPLGDGSWIPAYPSQLHSSGKLADFFPGQDAGRSWCYDVELGAHQLVPAGVLDPFSPETTRMLDHMEDVQFLADGWFDYPAAMNHNDWFNLGGFSKVQPYYTRNAEIYALRNEVKPFLRSYFNTLAAMLNPEVLTFWEHFNHSGAWDKTHETGYFLQQTRFMLVMEHGDELWLAPMIPREWLTDGALLSVSRAPTRFGPIGYRLSSNVAAGQLDAEIQYAGTSRPSKLVLRLRHPEGKPIRSAQVNGAPIQPFDVDRECLAIEPGGGLFRVQAKYDSF